MCTQPHPLIVYTIQDNPKKGTIFFKSFPDEIEISDPLRYAKIMLNVSMIFQHLKLQVHTVRMSLVDSVTNADYNILAFGQIAAFVSLFSMSKIYVGS